MQFLDRLQNQGVFKRLSRESSGTRTVSDSKVAIRNGDEVFFAHQSTIRCAKVSDSTAYKVLDVSELDFEITGLKLNSSGTLLAVYNQTNVLVISLPTSSFMKSSNTLVDVTTFTISPELFQRVGVKEVLWNKVARFDSGLVILSTDGVIRSFDLRQSLVSPEAAYDLRSPNRHQVGLVANSVQDAVSITFGSQESLSGLLTLYILNKDGDVFSIYPFLPKTLSVTKDQIEDLLNESIILTNQELDEEKRSQKRASIIQLNFVNHLWKQVVTSHKEIRDSKELCVLKPSNPDLYTIQGPFAIQPYPEALYDDLALSISSVQCGTMNDLLVISFNKSGIIMLLQDKDLTMKFQEEVFEDYLVLSNSEEDYSTYTLSTLEFKSNIQQTSSWIGDVADVSLFLLQKTQDIYQVDLKDLGTALDGSLDEEKTFEELIGSCNSKIQHLMTLQLNESYEGHGVVHNEYKEKYLCLLTNQKLNVFVLADGHNGSKGGPNETKKCQKVSYDVKLGSPDVENGRLLRQAVNFQIKSHSSRSQVIFEDESSLREVNDISSQVLKQLVLFHKLSLSLNYRLINQRNEFQRQIDCVNEFSERSEILHKKSKSIPEAVKVAVKRQTLITERFIKLSEKMSSSSLSVPITPHEKKWFQEIQKLIISFNKSVKQNVVIKEQLKFLKSEIDAKSNSKILQKDHEFENWDEVNRILKQGRALIDKTSATLQKDIAELDSQMDNVRI